MKRHWTIRDGPAEFGQAWLGHVILFGVDDEDGRRQQVAVGLDDCGQPMRHIPGFGFRGTMSFGINSDLEITVYYNPDRRFGMIFSDE